MVGPRDAFFQGRSQDRGTKLRGKRCLRVFVGSGGTKNDTDNYDFSGRGGGGERISSAASGNRTGGRPSERQRKRSGQWNQHPGVGERVGGNRCKAGRAVG